MSTSTNEVVNNAIVRHGFGSSEQLSRGVDYGSDAAAAYGKAQVEARYIMAMRCPRSWDVVRQSLLKECSRPSFANDPSALYFKPIGDGVEGLGIRFAEVAARCMTNLSIDTPTVYEDETRRQIRVIITDLESNITYSRDVNVTKTVERLQPRKGDVILSSRLNSDNQQVFTISASEDALLNKEGALVSKSIRTNILRLVPGDLQDECEEIIRRIRREKATADPDAAKRKIIDTFAALNVTVQHLEAYLEHPIGECTPDELVKLRNLYGALKDGETTWAAVMENAEERQKVETGAKKQPKGNEGVKSKIQPSESPAEQKAAPSGTVPTAPAEKAAAKEKAKPVEVAPAPAAQAAKEEKKVDPPKTEVKPEPVKAEVKAESKAEPAAKTEAPAPPPVDEAAPWFETVPLSEQGKAQTATAPEPPPAKPVETAVVAPPAPQAQAAPPTTGSKPLIIRKVQFPSVLTKADESDGYTPEQLDKVNIECARLGVVAGATVENWLKLNINDISKDTMECIYQVLVDYKRSA